MGLFRKKKEEKEDCAITVMKSARGKWQKSVGEVLLEVEGQIKEINTNYKWIKWLITSTFAASIISLVALLIRVGIGG